MELRDGLVHASCVDLDGRGILIVGASGSGKSSLALEFMHLGATLVSDDQVRLEGGSAHSVAALEGMIEVRGIGLLACPFVPKTTLMLVIDMDTAPTRLPDRKSTTPRQIELISGKDVAKLALGAKLLLENGRKT